METTKVILLWNWCEPENGLTIEECEQIIEEQQKRQLQ